MGWILALTHLHPLSPWDHHRLSTNHQEDLLQVTWPAPSSHRQSREGLVWFSLETSCLVLLPLYHSPPDGLEDLSVSLSGSQGFTMHVSHRNPSHPQISKQKESQDEGRVRLPHPETNSLSYFSPISSSLLHPTQKFLPHYVHEHGVIQLISKTEP